jgi:hypothetical protein
VTPGGRGGRRSRSRREWGGAAITLIALAGLASVPGYRDRLGSAWRQTRGIPIRARMSLDEIRFDQIGEPYAVIRRVKESTYDDAVILLSDAPADPPPLRSIAWCAYYLYPRVLIHPEALRTTPGLEADFVITTPNFAPGLPDSAGAPHLGLLPLSDRARRYAEGWAR